MTSPRILAEAEVRSAVYMLMLALQYARRTMAAWSPESGSPRQGEIDDLVMWLRSAEQEIVDTVRAPAGTGSSFDSLAGIFQMKLDQLDKMRAVPRDEDGRSS